MLPKPSRPAYPSFSAHGKRDGGTAEVTLNGEFDLAAVAEATKVLGEAFATPSPRMLLVDLSGVTFMSSSGLSVLLTTVQLGADHTVVTRLFASSESAARTTLKLTGLEAVLPLYATRADAVDDVNRLGKNG